MNIHITKTYNIGGLIGLRQNSVRNAAEKMGYKEMSLFRFPDIYDTDDEIETILEDANSIDMFGNKKLIIVNNSIIFSETKQEKNIEKLINYIKSPNQDCILIFTISVEKLDERKKIIKEIRKNCIVKEFNNFDNKVIKDN